MANTFFLLMPRHDFVIRKFRIADRLSIVIIGYSNYFHILLIF